MAASGLAEVISTRPRLTWISGTTSASFASIRNGPPEKSTAKRQEKYSRLRPTTPPKPVRVATTEASSLFDLVPDESEDPIELRLVLTLNGEALTETWVYQYQPPPGDQRTLY